MNIRKMKAKIVGTFNLYCLAKAKMLLLVCIILADTVFISCQKKKNIETENKTTQSETTQQNSAKQNHEGEIVTASAIDKAGVRLDMVFHNAKGTAIFTINGETIDMKQDTMGSGVKYSNEKYEYTDWHGRIELKKEGKTIFLKNEKQ